MTNQIDLFAAEPDRPSSSRGSPLAYRMRPAILEHLVGQQHLLSHDAPFRKALEADSLGSMILWGPPGCGKTSLALVIAAYTAKRFVKFSAVTAGLPELRKVVSTAKLAQSNSGRRTVLFVDEIHRFNRTQQDGFLPHVEDGTLLLIGATTENPSFQLVGPLLSRCAVYPLYRLEAEDVLVVLKRALVDEERGLGRGEIAWEEGTLRLIGEMADGDLRKGLNLLEAVVQWLGERSSTVTKADIREVASFQALLYDRAGEEHYNLISALHKCIRDSDPDAALYWLARMLEAGEDPLFLARRLVRIASEDIGIAAPQALTMAVAAMQTVKLLGLPEADCALAEAAVYLALAPKSNSIYVGLSNAKKDARDLGSLPVPLVLRNAPTGLMKDLGYGDGYKYAHDDQKAARSQQHWPDGVKSRKYYRPRDSGWEKKGTLGKSEIRSSKSETNPNDQNPKPKTNRSEESTEHGKIRNPKHEIRNKPK